MAGFMGIPLGNIGAMGGADYSPLLRMQQMQQQQSMFDREMQEQMARRAGAESMSLSQMEFDREQAQARQQAESQRFGETRRQFDVGTVERRQAEESRRELEKARLELAQQGEEERKRQFERQFGLRERAESRDEERHALGREQLQRAESEREQARNVEEVRARMTGLVEQGAEKLKGDGMTPEAIRSYMLQEAANTQGVSPGERQAMIDAVLEWYDREVSAADRGVGTEVQRERIAESREARESRERAANAEQERRRLVPLIEALQNNLAIMVRQPGREQEAKALEARIEKLLDRLLGVDE